LTVATKAPADSPAATREPAQPGWMPAEGRTGMHLFIVGAGYVGLVTAAGMAGLGHQVTLADIDAKKIEALQAGVVPIFEPGLEDALRDLGDRIAFTTDVHPPADARHSFVAVGTPPAADGSMDFGNVVNVVRTLLAATGPDHTVVVRSTLTPAAPALLQALRGPGPGAAVVTNPEFLREGSALADFQRPGRIVTGWLSEGDRPAAEAVLDLYAGIDAPTFVADARSVALVKLASNVFLAMKVAYANEVARLCDAFGANAALVADGIGLDARIGRAFLDAGPGIGGSCLPEQAVALDLLARGAGVAAPLIGSVATANDVHRSEIVRRLATLLEVEPGAPAASGGSLAGRRIAVLGLAFKANTDDVRQSPALAIAALLREAGASVVGTDPRAAAQARRADPDLEIAPTVDEAVAGADAVLVATEWAAFASLEWPVLAAHMRGTLVYDTRAIVDAAAVRAAGLRLERLGRSHAVDEAASDPAGPDAASPEAVQSPQQ
jgi:UDPglucose 6-dehydrogenase